MSKEKLSEALCEKICTITRKYVKENPEEWSNFKKQQQYLRDNLRTKWAEIPGSGIEFREILQTPEVLFAMFRGALTDVEFLEFGEQRYKFWFGNKFPDFKTVEGKL